MMNTAKGWRLLDESTSDHGLRQLEIIANQLAYASSDEVAVQMLRAAIGKNDAFDRFVVAAIGLAACEILDRRKGQREAHHAN